MKMKPLLREKRWLVKFEEELLETWEKEDIYAFDIDSNKPVFSIDTPPPYASGKWHVGGAAHYAQIDMIARYFRMKGYNVLFPFGIDRNGLPVEVEVEKKYGVNAHEMKREEFLKLCREFLDEVENDIIKIAKRLGMSCDFKNIYRTDSPEYRRITQKTFAELWRRGLIYEAERPINWCPVCKTTIADAEIEYKETLAELYYIKFALKKTGEPIVIATTRPELLCACVAIIFNPRDERYQSLEGQEAIVPLYGKEVPIIAHSAARSDFGTGLVMICSFGDYTDIRLIRELKLSPSIAIDPDGKMNKNAGFLVGLPVEEARKKIVEKLKEENLLVKSEKILHKVPVCWRSKNPIEFIAMKEYYLKQLPFLRDLLSLIDRIEFYPPESKQLLLNWINSINTDWPISRRRFYGTEIPLWYCKKCGKAYLPTDNNYHQPWREPCPIERCECGSTEFTGEQRTFDTWMDSSISQLYILGYGYNSKLLNKTFPCSLRPQGQDIVRTWLYYSLLRTYQLTKREAFKRVRISGMGLDEKGEAMHKSKGNIIYPESYLEKYGADAFRLWNASEAKLGSNYRFSEERLAAAAKFLTKLWNIARFISMFPYPSSYKPAPLDELTLAKLNEVIEKCDTEYSKMDFFLPSLILREFTWSYFADHYIEAIKFRAYNTDGTFTRDLQHGAWHTLHTCLQVILKLLAPICPFITDKIWRSLYGGTIHKKEFPKPIPVSDPSLAKLYGLFMAFNSAVWKYKISKRLALSQEIDTVKAPNLLEKFKDDLKAMHKIKNIIFTEDRNAVEINGVKIPIEIPKMLLVHT